MTWQILWALIFGFVLAAVVQAVVRRSTIIRRLGDDRPRTLAIASGFGVASSSCSYAAVAIARALFRTGASFTAAMVFEIASTNLVVELGVILAVLIGWQFTLAEFIGGPIMIVLIAVAFRLFLRQTAPRRGQGAEREGPGRIDGGARGHGHDHPEEGSLWQRLRSKQALTSISHIFVMEWAAVIRDVVIGLLLAGAIAAWVPDSFWHHFFAVGHPTLSKVWGPLIGPVVSMVSCVCSIGNVPLAGVLWNAGMSFGGVISFIFADLIILPILFIYKKYYGTRMMLFILATFYATMVAAGYAVELLFSVFGLVPTVRDAKVGEVPITWDYTTVLNIVAVGGGGVPLLPVRADRRDAHAQDDGWGAGRDHAHGSSPG